MGQPQRKSCRGLLTNITYKYMLEKQQQQHCNKTRYNVAVFSAPLVTFPFSREVPRTPVPGPAGLNQ